MFTLSSSVSIQDLENETKTSAEGMGARYKKQRLLRKMHLPMDNNSQEGSLACSGYQWASFSLKVSSRSLSQIFCKHVHTEILGGGEEGDRDRTQDRHEGMTHDTSSWPCTANNEKKRKMSVCFSNQSLPMFSAKRTLNRCCCTLATSEADVNKYPYIHTDTPTGFYLQTTNWKKTPRNQDNGL